MSYRKTLVKDNKYTMKTFTFRWLICLSLLFFVTPCLYAQRFSFWNNMYTGWSSANLGGDVKKPSTKTFKLSDALYNHLWTLTTDGKCAGQNGETKCIHVGTGSSYSQYLILETTTSFSFVDVVRVATAVTKSRKYTLDVVLMKGEENLKASLVYGVQKDGVTTRIFEFDNNKDIGEAAKLKVEMKGEKYEEGALCLFFIEVASVLSDRQELQQQHIQPEKIYSYQVQRTFASTHWNTICLPFDVSKDALKEAMGKNCALREFTQKVGNNVLKFDKTDAITAGVPYLIKPAVEVKNPIFSNVVYKDVKPQTVQDETGKYAFVGTFDPVKLSVDGSELFLLSNGNLAKPKSDKVNEMYGMRAYFKINEQNSTSAKQITYAIDCDSETVTGIQSPVYPSTNSQHIYNLQGVDVGADIHHLPAGVYVMGGKKIMKR